jgi:hypothetical protein
MSKIPPLPTYPSFYLQIFIWLSEVSNWKIEGKTRCVFEASSKKVDAGREREKEKEREKLCRLVANLEWYFLWNTRIAANNQKCRWWRLARSTFNLSRFSLRFLFASCFLYSFLTYRSFSLTWHTLLTVLFNFYDILF